MWMLDLGRGLWVFVDVWETFSIETEAAERVVTDVNIWTFDSEAIIISSHSSLGHALELMALDMLFSCTAREALWFESEMIHLATHVWIGESPAVLSDRAFIFWNVYFLLSSISLLRCLILSFVLLSYCCQKHRIMLCSLCASRCQILRTVLTKNSGCDRPLRCGCRRPLLIWW